ncbi:MULTISPECIES: (-)-alpha-amorphene synthase [Streptomyces]|uniref:Sesquiterpene cyclase n=1 Tax=Streptomyces koelreuteriae TaxID=2838015 RepID=A0ABX8G1Z8_9ACTN|nr:MULTISPECIES: (-)-alpha-amorphene synthase [Streptomyces]QWB27262.1 sesquiterpene cyclase [Streptomyces koelreuteriae]UUA10347.1 sesquiterpene cyclase [Streptomyces koelreuteriae]UUA17954.1 sesquiterpene cyclase [Streptomyces sp. CRCS-T-1]
MSTAHEEITLAAQEKTRAVDLRELIDANLYMPFPFERNPHALEASAGVDAWLSTWGLTDDPAVAAMISYTRPAELAACNSPSMDSGLLQIVANQIAYQFVFDDRAEDVGRRSPARLLPMLSESIAILRDGRPPTTPLGAALTDLYRQVRERCTPDQAARWAWYSREYVHGLLYEAVAQVDSDPVGSGLCRDIRSLIAGVQPFYPLCEAAQPCELTPQEIHHPVMRRLSRLSADAAVWIPDLFSAVKEQRAGGMINLALAYQRTHRCSLPVAVTLAARHINRTIREFEELYGEIGPELSPSGVGYVEGMAGWIRGCYFWSRTVPRYADTMAAPAGL